MKFDFSSKQEEEFQLHFQELQNAFFKIDEFVKNNSNENTHICLVRDCSSCDQNLSAQLIGIIHCFIERYKKIEHNKEFCKLYGGKTKELFHKTLENYEVCLEARKKAKKRNKKERHKENKKKKKALKEEFIVSKKISSFDAAASYDFFKKRFAQAMEEACFVSLS